MIAGTYRRDFCWRARLGSAMPSKHSFSLLCVFSIAAAGSELADGWKTIHVYVGNETDDPHSVFNHAYSPAHHIWHSQVGQDKTVALLTQGAPGFFVDLAANDAVKLSNTLTLERDFGWDGICIEPNPTYWLGLSRRKCEVVAVVAGRERDQSMQFVFGQTIGGLVGTQFDNKHVVQGNTETLHTLPLLEIFRKARVTRVIDYMSFDVEGAESFIGSVFPWREYRINLLTVERPREDLKQILKMNASMVHLKTHGGFGDEMWCHVDKEAEYRRILRISP